MTEKDFCYWLQGFFELSDSKELSLNSKQVELIRKHLNLVFFHAIDTSYTEDLPKEESEKIQEKLNEIHGKVQNLENRPDPNILYRC